MLKNYIKISFRSLRKNKLFFLINILGLGITLACCIVAYLNYDFNAKFDQEQSKADKIYRLNFERNFQGSKTKFGIAPNPLAGLIALNQPDVKATLRYYGTTSSSFKKEQDLHKVQISYADDNFFEFFDFTPLSGSLDAIAEKKNIIISSKLAQRLFGEEQAVGKSIVQLVDSTQIEYFVAAVFETKMSNSSFSGMEAITLYDNLMKVDVEMEESNWKQWNTTFFWVENAANVAKIERGLIPYIEPQNKAREDLMVDSYYLDVFKGIAQRSKSEEVRGHWLSESMEPPAVLAPLIMAFMVLLIACFNFTNTSIAIASKRLKEIGIRKVMGGMRKQLIIQFLAENLMLCFMALLVALVLASYLVPAYNNLWPFVNISLDYYENADFLLFLVALLMATGLAAGSYPAFYISRFEPSSILKGTYSLGQKSWLTKTLWCFQYAISLSTVIACLAFYNNARYQQELDYGYDKDALIHFWLDNPNDFQYFKSELEAHPDITQVTGTKHQVFQSYYNDPIAHETTKLEVDIMEVGEDYFAISGMDIVEGRSFKQGSATDMASSIVVNETFNHALGWEDAIGKKIRWKDSLDFYVVGVVKDFYTNGLWDEIEPMMLRFAPKESYQLAIVKAKPKNIVAAHEFIQEKWKEHLPDKAISISYFNNQMTQALMVNNNIVTMYMFLGFIAVLLSASGLFTLVSLNIIKRFKEIGIRKVLGASVLNIAKETNKSFILFMLVAFVVGVGLSYGTVDLLMSSIWKYYAGIDALTIATAIGIMLLVAVLSVGYKIYSASITNPASILKDE